MHAIKRHPVAIVAAGALLMALALPAAGAEFGGELRVYPSGVIPSASIDLPIDAHNWISPSIAYEFAERGSNGEHDDESGGGIGIGASFDHYFAPRRAGWFVGGRVELFFLDIDWADPGRSGSTEVTVLQPTIRGGYGWRFDGGRYGLQLALSLGDEINVDTRGEDVGDGAILLGGAAFTFRP